MIFYCSIGKINTACIDSYGITQTYCFSTAILTPAHLAASTASQQRSFRAQQKLDMETHALLSPRGWAMRPSLQAISQVDMETQHLCGIASFIHSVHGPSFMSTEFNKRCSLCFKEVSPSVSAASTIRLEMARLRERSEPSGKQSGWS